MKVSFIIPVYNIEKYIRECVESILSQTYTDFEVILVDDGSKDSSPKICDELSKEDSRIRVLHKVNGGLSDARNEGVKLAQGEYIIFIDGDDFWVNNHSLQTLMDTISKYPECDFLGFNCSYYYGENGTYKKWVSYDDSLGQPIDKNTALSKLVASGTVPMSACFKILSSKFLKENNICFIKGIKGEDIPWFIDLMDKCNKCMFINEYVYAYRQNVPNSITATGGLSNFNNYLEIINREISIIKQRNFSNKALEALYSFLAYEYCILLARLSSLPSDIRNNKRKELMKLKWLLKYTANPKVAKVATVYKYFGIYITELLLRFYLKRKKNNSNLA